MKNKMTDLRNHLFETIEKLKDAENSAEIEREISRAKAIVGVAEQVIDSARVEVEFVAATGADVTGEFFDDSYRAGKNIAARLEDGPRRLSRGA